jgi:hypothetical protein
MVERRSSVSEWPEPALRTMKNGASGRGSVVGIDGSVEGLVKGCARHPTTIVRRAAVR